MLHIAIDNDILVKGICYGLLDEMVDAIPSQPNGCGILGSSLFVIPAILESKGRGNAVELFFKLIDSLSVLEPTQAEILSASELEASAQRAGLNLDHGESLLSAIVGSRELDRLVTGDKRAVVALEAILQDLNRIDWLVGKVICLEQIFKLLIAHGERSTVRSSVCQNADVDQSITLCFSCSNPIEEPQFWCDGLDSYINHLRSMAPNILAK